MIEMNHDLINTIGIKQIAREEAHLYQVSDVQGLIDTLAVSYTHLTLPTT